MSQLFVKIFMGLLGLVLLAFLLAALGIYVVWATLRWLLTGRKPQVVMVWQQFSAMRQNFGQGGFRGASGSGFEGPRGPNQANDDQVVDVEVREVVEDAPRLPRK
jgi:hypothetical protein